MIPGSWQHRMKLQLFLKASKAYYVLSDAATNLLKYGRALRYIKLSMQCYGKAVVQKMKNVFLMPLLMCSFVFEAKQNENRVK